MPLNYRIDPAKVPKLWRDNITPNTDDTGTYYYIGNLCENNGVAEEAIPDDIRPKYKYDGSDFPGWVYYSDSDIQTTIPELKVDDNRWLALIGSNPTLYHGSSISGNAVNLGLTLSTGKDPMLYTCYGFQYTNWCQPGQTIQYGELYGGVIFQVGNFSGSDHLFSIWGDGTHVIIKEYTPPKAGNEQQYYTYSDSPRTYTFSGDSWNYGRGEYIPKPVNAVLVMICGAGGGGRPGSFAKNGAGGGAGATGIFKVSLTNTSEEYPITISLGHAGGSSNGGSNSYITHTSAAGVTEGYYVCGGGTGKSNEDPGQGGDGGVVKSFNSNAHKKIKLYDYVNGANGGADISGEKTTIGKTGSAFILRTGKGNSSGNGGNSAFAGGGVLGGGIGGSFGASPGSGGGWPSAGGGGGKGPSQLGGSGGAGGASYLLITY